MTIRAEERTPTLAEVMRAAMDTRLRDVHTLLPGVIESYDAATQSADVKPTIQNREADSEGNEFVEPYPVIRGCPVVFPRAGSAFMSWPLEPGHNVTIEIVQRSIDNWVGSNGEDIDPDDYRMHDISDAIVRPGLYPFGQAIGSAHPSNITIGFDSGLQIHIEPGSGAINLGEETAQEFVALADQTAARISRIESRLNDHFIDFYNKHTHEYILPLIPADLSDSEPPKLPDFFELPFLAGGNIAASKVKAT